jgi:WD40 repeat protein
VLLLPDGCPIAVTVGADASVQVWDLRTGSHRADPLRGHAGTVRPVSALVLPDGRPIAVTGSDGATVRIWDLQQPAGLVHPLHVGSGVTALATWAIEGGVGVVLGGAGLLARVDVGVPR